MSKISIEIDLQVEVVIQWLIDNGFEYIIHKEKKDGGYTRYERGNPPTRDDLLNRLPEETKQQITDFKS